MVKKTYEEVLDERGNVIWKRKTVVYDDSHERASRDVGYRSRFDWCDGIAGASSRKIREAYEDHYRSDEW